MHILDPNGLEQPIHSDWLTVSYSSFQLAWKVIEMQEMIHESPQGGQKGPPLYTKSSQVLSILNVYNLI